MNDDISIGLLEEIQKSFNLGYDQSEKIKCCLKKMEQKKATYETAHDYAIEVGEILADVFGNIQASELPDEKMYYNIAKKLIEPTLTNNFELISNYSMQVQKVLNEPVHIGTAVVSSKINQKQIDGIINKVSSAKRYDDVSWMLQAPIVQFSQNIVDRTIKANAELHYSQGRTPTITRTVHGNACPWCMKLAGVYSYPNHVPDDIYRRHNDCRCLVVYDPKDGTRRKQDVHNKSKWLDDNVYKERLKEYNSNPTRTLKDMWRSGVKDGWISALVNYEDYFDAYSQLYTNLVGERTKDGIEIKSISEHFMQRLFGTLIDPKIYEEQHRIVRRSGVEVENIIDALLNGSSRKTTIKNGKPSKTYYNKKCLAAINPNTGLLTQCNLI